MVQRLPDNFLSFEDSLHMLSRISLNRVRLLRNRVLCMNDDGVWNRSPEGDGLVLWVPG